ncbi:hypothetical protein ACLOJK_031684, partial [Asimina triloba]
MRHPPTQEQTTKCGQKARRCMGAASSGREELPSKENITRFDVHPMCVCHRLKRVASHCHPMFTENIYKLCQTVTRYGDVLE